MISKDKTYKTRDGREVRIYAVDGESEWPVHGAVYEEGKWKQRSWRADGQFTVWMGNPGDLIEVKPRIKREVWVNVYPDEMRSGSYHTTKERASGCADRNRVACVRLTIDCEHGEGL